MGRTLDAGANVLKFPGGKASSGKAITAPGLLAWPARSGAAGVTHPGWTGTVSAQEWDRQLLDLDSLGTAIATGFSVRKKPVVVQMNDLLIWANGVDAVKVYDPAGANVYDLGVAAPAAAPTAADTGSGSFAGKYTYWYRYKRSSTGEYSALSDGVSWEASGSGTHIRVTTVASAGTDVDKTELFRSKTGHHGIYRIAEYDDTTLTYDDNTADSAINITLAPPVLPAPGGSASVPVFDEIAHYQGRLWGMINATSKVHWSESFAPWLFPAENARSLPQTRDEGTGFAVAHDQMYISQRSHLFMLANKEMDEDTGQIIPDFRLVDDSTGFASQRAACIVENTLFFMSGEGKIYQTAGASVAQERAHQIEEMLKRQFTKRLYAAEAGYAEHERKVYFAVSLDESPFNNATLVGDTTTGGWTLAEMDIESLHEFRDSDGRGRLCFGNIRGDICQVGVGNGYGARKGTLSGSPTAGTINTLSDSTAAFDADLAGVPVALFDGNNNLLQTNLIAVRDSATALTMLERWTTVPNTAHTYVVGGQFPEWKFGVIDVNDHLVFNYMNIGYVKSRGKAGIYISVDDGPFDLVDTINLAGPGHHEAYPGLGGKRFQVAIRGFDGAAPFAITNLDMSID